MGNDTDSSTIASAGRTRILLICPDCGQENAEFADKLRGMSSYACSGVECSYRFDLVHGPRKDVLRGFAEAMRKLYAALTPAD
jgi:hypothetical protein